MFRMLGAWCVLAGVCGVCPHAVWGEEAASTAARRETWQAVAVRGQRIGYGHLVSIRDERDGEILLVSDFRMHTVMKRFDGKVTMIVDQHIEEDLQGNLKYFQYQLDNPPAGRVETTGTVADGTLTLATTAGGQTTRKQVKVPPELKSPLYPDRMLEEQPLERGAVVELKVFDPQLSAVLSLRVTNDGPASFQLPEGEVRQGSRLVIEYLDGIPGLSIDNYADATGRLVLNEAKLLGTTTWDVSREEALKDLPGDVDVGLAALIKVETIPDAANTQRAVYRIHSAAGLSDGLFAESEMQQVERIDDKTMRLSIHAMRPGDAVPPPLDAEPPGAMYLEPTTMARSDDPEIVRLAERAAGPEASPVEVAIGAERLVHQWLTRKNMSTNLATASEVVRSKSGDCTEHAVLLAAILRARKIPARMAVGLVYWDRYSAFAGHAWTEAWLEGRWIPLDATQASGGIGADHIRLAESTLADGDAGLIAGAVSTWRLLDSASIQVEEIQRRPSGEGQ